MGSIEFPDHFSSSARSYARFRLTYPESLYDHLITLVPALNRCWDCATGNGQAAAAWVRFFEEVIATDASENQLAQAPDTPGVRFRRELAEETSLDDASVELISVAAAIHWFELDRFYSEVRRVAREGAVLAAWSYGARMKIDDEIDDVITRFVDGPLDRYWPGEFHHIRTEYREIAFPFEELEMPPLAAVARWSLSDLLGNMRTWSGVQAYRSARDEDPVSLVEEELTRAWCQDSRTAGDLRTCEWPLFFRVGRI